jgi:hypothetical protein
MYEFETVLAAYLAIIISVLVSLYLNHRTLSRTDKNLELSRKNLDEIKKGQLLSTYPFLSQKIDKECQKVYIAGVESYDHYMVNVKNYGKGPAVNQQSVHYEFYDGENKIHQRTVKIVGAHDIVAPGDERLLDLTVLSENEWREIEKKYDTVMIQLPHEDMQRNKCCNCTKYIRQPQIDGGYGKFERHWYFSAIPEISSEKCKTCIQKPS